MVWWISFAGDETKKVFLFENTGKNSGWNPKEFPTVLGFLQQEAQFRGRGALAHAPCL